MIHAIKIAKALGAETLRAFGHFIFLDGMAEV